MNVMDYDDIIETRPEPFKRFLQLSTDVMNDAKNISEAYRVTVDQALKAMEIGLVLAKQEADYENLLDKCREERE